MNQRVITVKFHFGCSGHRIPQVKDSSRLRNCQVELRLSTCACVYKPEKDVPGSFISLSIPFTCKFSCAKTFFPCPPSTTRHSLAFHKNILCLNCMLSYSSPWQVKKELHYYVN